MTKHITVIDCGTNTFTLSLFEIKSPTKFKRINKLRHFVELAEEGIHAIGPKAFARGLEAFKSFHAFLKDYPDSPVFAMGTAALRRAANRDEFIKAVKEVSNIDISIIDGDKEAWLIYKGVERAAPLSEKPSLIMDIGGGSVEFIVANEKELLWAKSYSIGNSVLFEKFHRSNPVATSEIQALETFLKVELQDLFEVLKQYSIEHLIGASGSFDVLDTLVGLKVKEEHYGYIEMDDFDKLHDWLIHTTLEERLALQKLPPTRAKLIVMSVCLIHFIKNKLAVNQLVASDYALREGVIVEILEKEV